MESILDHILWAGGHAEPGAPPVGWRPGSAEYSACGPVAMLSRVLCLWAAECSAKCFACAPPSELSRVFRLMPPRRSSMSVPAQRAEARYRDVFNEALVPGSIGLHILHI